MFQLKLFISFLLKRVSELIIISNLHCQRIHYMYFALRNLPFRLESKSLTDILQ